MKTTAKEIKIGEYIITGYSRALMSSWMGLPQFGVLFDCGDGVSSRLGGSIGSYKYVAVTHSHMDHITGLSQLINLRSRLNPDLKTTVIYPPQVATRVETQLSMLGQRGRDSVITSVIDPLKPHDIDIGGNRVLSWFPTNHSGTGSCGSVGYVIKSKKNIRKPEYALLYKEEILKLVEAGTELSESVMVPIVAYVGDSPAISDDVARVIAGVELLIMEATIINPEDFESDEKLVHSSVSETLLAAAKAQPKHLVINHLSPRYHDSYATSQIEKRVGFLFTTSPKMNFSIHRLAGDDMYTVLNEH